MPNLIQNLAQQFPQRLPTPQAILASLKKPVPSQIPQGPSIAQSFSKKYLYNPDTKEVLPQSIVSSNSPIVPTPQQLNFISHPSQTNFDASGQSMIQQLSKNPAFFALTSPTAIGGSQAISAAGATKPQTLYRAVDSTNKNAVLGEGKYFAFDKNNVARYGKDIREFKLDPNAKMLDLSDPNKLSEFDDLVRQNNIPDFLRLSKSIGPEKAIQKLTSDYAKKLGYDGIIADDKAFGSVIFNEDVITPLGEQAGNIGNKVLAGLGIGAGVAATSMGIATQIPAVRNTIIEKLAENLTSQPVSVTPPLLSTTPLQAAQEAIYLAPTYERDQVIEQAKATLGPEIFKQLAIPIKEEPKYALDTAKVMAAADIRTRTQRALEIIANSSSKKAKTTEIIAKYPDLAKGLTPPEAITMSPTTPGIPKNNPLVPDFIEETVKDLPTYAASAGQHIGKLLFPDIYKDIQFRPDVKGFETRRDDPRFAKLKEKVLNNSGFRPAMKEYLSNIALLAGSETGQGGSSRPGSQGFYAGYKRRPVESKNPLFNLLKKFGIDEFFSPQYIALAQKHGAATPEDQQLLLHEYLHSTPRNSLEKDAATSDFLYNMVETGTWADPKLKEAGFEYKYNPEEPNKRVPVPNAEEAYAEAGKIFGPEILNNPRVGKYYTGVFDPKFKTNIPSYGSKMENKPKPKGGFEGLLQKK